MVTPLLIRPCTPAELPALVGLLDEEFIFSKGRGVSLAKRLPTALYEGNCPNILLACRGDEIAACIVIKRFDWITPERNWRGAMIGLVYTRPAERGQGLASQLLRATEEKLRADGTAFAVLWTAQPDFYHRLGWTSSDRGVFGTYASAGGTTASCNPADVDAIETLRLRNPGAYTPRGTAGYRTLPLPAERLELRLSPGRTAYAIFGVQADRAYVYEFGGEPSAYAVLWQDICAVPHTVHINARRGNAAHQWLVSVPGIVWRDQALAMWLPLAEPACARHFSDWYVPYLDRI
ncbi:MAG: GNAT family N-acetyltransferase [Betaproteobacteria bacterium]|nr:GNAT family N-acetyltransferase [Betaproteobacteria bacterium]